MRKWLRRIGLILLLPALLVLGAILYVGFKVLTYSQGDDEARLANKAAYLEQVAGTAPARSRGGRPNVLIVFYDDLGYGDLGFTGSKAIRTPNIDALAERGTVMTNFHSSSPVCSPSRAGLLTGRLPPRAGMPSVVFPSDSWMRVMNMVSGNNRRIPAEEITIADVLKADGYRTGMIGKWHIGDTEPSLPNSMGFDSYYGALYSNDMQPFALYRNREIEVEAPADQTQMNALYTREAVRFIAAGGADNAPFLLYFAHNFPHIPLYAPDSETGISDAGLYGDVVEGLDRGIGEIVAALEATGQLDNTILILTSDNGPWFEGSPGMARGRKGQTFEGGMHVPFLIHWPAGLEGQRSVPSMAMNTDIFPTLLDWLEIGLPQDRMIDGASLRTTLEQGGAAAARFHYFYAGDTLMAVSDGRYKYYDRQPYPYVNSGGSFAPNMPQGPWLFDLERDPDESYDISMKQTDIAERLREELDRKRQEDSDNLRGWK